MIQHSLRKDSTVFSIMLCSVCTGFNVRELLLKAHAQSPRSHGDDPSSPPSVQNFRPAITHFFKQHTGLLRLRSSASNCELCHCIWEDYVRKNSPNDCTDYALGRGTNSRQIFIGTAAWDATLHGLPHLAVTQDGDLGAIRVLANFEVCALRGHEPVDHQELLARSIYSNSGSPECLRLAGGLLENCLNNHKSCSSHNAKLSEFPTRLIDTGSVNPKLVNSDGRQGVYAALSYCWGGETGFTLTSTTEQSFRAGQPLDQFPATLRDAIIITRALGIRYIWIDALCIFQDSDQDWAQEASKMCDVYHGAVVTLAAACASNTHEGILRERQDSTMPQCWLDWRADDATTRVFLRSGSELWDENFHQSILNTRGWTLQETLLAPRTLWFGQQQLGFECAEGSVSEAGRSIRTAEIYRSKGHIQKLRGQPIPLWRRRLLTFLRSLNIPTAILFPMPSLPGALEVKASRTLGSLFSWEPVTLQGSFDHPGNFMGLSHFDFWVHIIQNYTSRHLSKSTDALPALSGLASEFHRATGDTYLAGLWKSNIIEGLSWNRVQLETKPMAQALVNDLAPSWSWASVPNSKVFFGIRSQFDHVIRFAKVLDVTIYNLTPDPFGAVNRGSITLHAPFLDIGTDDIVAVSHRASSIYPNLRAELCKTTPDVNEYLQKHRGYSGQRYAILQLFKTWRAAEYSRRASKHINFLLLESMETEPGYWRRIGCFRLTEEPQAPKRAATRHEVILAEIRPDLKRQIMKIS
ncbi:HET-domain-containing protein [Xylaria sp. FL1042]|nr:HET-domain-containing protein [Xylaria sp. FL1042]